MSRRERLLVFGCIWSIALSGCCFNSVAMASGADDAVFEKAYVDWKARRAAIRVLDVAGKGRIEFLKGCWTGEEGFPEGTVPQETLQGELFQRLVLEFQVERARIETINCSINAWDATLQREEFTRIFDGQEMRKFYHNDSMAGRPGAWTNVSMQIDEFDHMLLVPFGCIGIRGDATIRGAFKYGFDALQPHRLDSLGDVRCAVFRSVERPSDNKMFSEYWVDPARDNVIVRYTSFFPNGNPHSDVYYEYENVESPDPILRWSLCAAQGKDFRVGVPEVKLASVRLMSSIKVHFNESPSEGLFDMRIAPGLSVYDYKAGRLVATGQASDQNWSLRSVMLFAINFTALLGLVIWFRRGRLSVKPSISQGG